MWEGLFRVGAGGQRTPLSDRLLTADEWTRKQAEGHPFVQELLTKPRILLIGTLNA